MLITREMIQKAEGWELNKLLAELLGWRGIQPGPLGHYYGILPEFDNVQTIIPDYSDNLTLIDRKVAQIGYNYGLIRTKKGSMVFAWMGLELNNKSCQHEKPATALSRALALVLLERKNNGNN